MNNTVSIVLCTYNGARYIEQQLDSIIAQTYPIHEIIVQDDGSTDDTWTILERYARNYSVIRLFRNEGRHGVNGNFLSAMRRATGSFIAVSDQDDIWEPHKIAEQMRAIGPNMMCSCHSRPFSSDGSFAHFDSRPRNTSIFRMMFLALPGHTLLFRRELLGELPPDNHPIFRHSIYDAALCITAAAHDSIVFLDSVLVNFRRHADAATYKDFHRSLPSWRNALNALVWGVGHYRSTRRLVLPLYGARFELMNQIQSAAPDFLKARLIMYLETRRGPVSFIRLQYHFVRVAPKLFQVCGDGFLVRLRAALYPILQLYMYK